MRLSLDEVVLRRPEPKDVGRLYLYRNDLQVAKWLGGFSAGYCIRDLEEWIESHRLRKDEIVWTIAEKKSDDCIGHVGLYQIDYRVRRAEFAILIGDTASWGRGIGRRVSAAVVDYGFRELNLHRIELSVLSSNARAIKLYEGLGFRREGLLKDAQFREGSYMDIVLMALFRTEC